MGTVPKMQNCGCFTWGLCLLGPVSYKPKNDLSVCAANNIMHLGCHVQCLKFYSILSKSVVSRQIFIKDHYIKFYRDFTSRKRTDSCSITERRTDKMKLIGVSQYVKKHLNSYTVVPIWFPSSSALSGNMF